MSATTLPLRQELAPTVDAASAQYSLPSGLLDSLLNQESGYNPAVVNGQIVSSAGAQGIAQFMPATARLLGINPLDPQQAIPGAAQYLRGLLDTFSGDVEKAVAAYNAGPGAVQRAVTASSNSGIDWRKLLPAETQSYLPAVLNPLAANSASTPTTGGVSSSSLHLPSIPNPLSGLPNPLDWAQGLAQLLGHLLDPHWWVTISLTVIGGLLIIGGIGIYVFSSSDTAKDIVKEAGSVAALA